MKDRKQGWLAVPDGPGKPHRTGYFVNGKLQAWAIKLGAGAIWHIHGSDEFNDAPSLEEAQNQAEKAVWEKS